MLSQNNYTEGRDQEITGKDVNMHAIRASVNMPIYTSIYIQVATWQDAYLSKLRSYILQGWPNK